MVEIYEEIANLDNNRNEIGVTPLSYVALGCAR